MDPGSLDDWKHRARCGVFALEAGVLVASNRGTFAADDRTPPAGDREQRGDAGGR